ncbi:MAG: NAD(P)/FAD-dependent oxidoreductase [Verrucomicrobia bacterium]|nr:NAD(P)/FAD-dependent oxidoreductase [Verrucomicrobiota bacterium]
MRYDVVIVGAGPAGAAAAAVAASHGLQAILIDRVQFPRDKVCGDCLNPGCWRIFDRLGVSAAVTALPHERMRFVEFVNLRGRALRLGLPQTGHGEIAVRRKILDDLLLHRAEAAGVTLLLGAPVKRIEPGWRIFAGNQVVEGKTLFAADGRNSTVARLLGDAPPIRTDRISFQTLFERDWEPHIGLELAPFGYFGRCTVGSGLVDLCLVCRAPDADAAKRYVSNRFGLAGNPKWSSIAPLARKPIRSRRPDMLYIGDAARIVEPFTGEGVFYALQSGALAADCLAEAERSGNVLLAWYEKKHRSMYRGRAWVNELAKLAILHPYSASWLSELLFAWDWPLEHLKNRVVAASERTIRLR